MPVSPRSTRLLAPFLIAVALLIDTPPPAEAQMQPRSGGLFSATRPEREGRNRLDLTGTAVEGYDSELPPEFDTGVQNVPQLGGFSTLLMGDLDYAYTRRVATFNVSGSTAFRYFQTARRFDPVGHTAGLGADFRLAQNARLKVEQSAAYSPSYLRELFPTVGEALLGEPIASTPDYRLVQGDSYGYRSSTSLSVGSERSTRFTGSANYEQTDFRDRGELQQQPDLNAYDLRAQVARTLRRNFTLSGEYLYRRARFVLTDEDGNSLEHRVGVTARYTRRLSASRSLELRGTFAPSVIDISESFFSELPPGRYRRLQGDGAVNYQFLRSWRAGATLERSVEYVAILAEPVFADSGRVTVEGLLSRRLDLQLTGGYSTGDSVIQLSAYDSVTANAVLRFALTRSVALYGEYLYFQYDMRELQQLAEGVPRIFEQHGIRAGITVWASPF